MPRFDRTLCWHKGQKRASVSTHSFSKERETVTAIQPAWTMRIRAGGGDAATWVSSFLFAPVADGFVGTESHAFIVHNLVAC